MSLAIANRRSKKIQYSGYPAPFQYFYWVIHGHMGIENQSAIVLSTDYYWVIHDHMGIENQSAIVLLHLVEFIIPSKIVTFASISSGSLSNFVKNIW